MDKAAELSIEPRSVSVGAVWSREGLWVPYSASIVLSEESDAVRELSGLIEAQLGIARERQEWRIEGSA